MTKSWCRAEATDVANAVLDGVDCIMLGAETLRGKHPVATVETILHICKQAEKVFDHNYHFETLMRVSTLSLSQSQRIDCTGAHNQAVSCLHQYLLLLLCGCCSAGSQLFSRMSNKHV